MKCRFCDSTEGLESCSWPVYEMAGARYSEVRKGHRVCRYSALASNPRTAEVLSVEVVPLSGLLPLVRIALSINGLARVKHIEVHSNSLVRIMRDRNCENACCEAHRVERGPGATCCADHWLSWSQVA